MARFLPILVIFGVIALLGLFYLTTRVHKFHSVGLLAGSRKAAGWLIALIPVALLVVYCVRHTVTGVIVAIHLIVFWALCDLLGWIIRKAAHAPRTWYVEGIAAILITVVYLSVGWYLAHHVVETDYALTTQKSLGTDTDTLRIVQISDSHLGATFDGDGFARHMETVNETHPDVVVVTGDFVDDDSTKEDMVKSCAALGRLETTYGVYFVFGNHDKGYMNYRDFSTQDLRDELAKSNVVILEDEAVWLNEDVCLIGRQDRSQPGRASMETLVQGIAPDAYTIVLDHQPHDFAAQADAGVDLVLCGHTHGGQMIPIGWTGEISGANDKTYGLEVREHTAFIVNSGISDWAIPFKTGTIAEFGVIDVSVQMD